MPLLNRWYYSDPIYTLTTHWTDVKQFRFSSLLASCSMFHIINKPRFNLSINIKYLWFHFFVACFDKGKKTKQSQFLFQSIGTAKQMSKTINYEFQVKNNEFIQNYDVAMLLICTSEQWIDVKRVWCVMPFDRNCLLVVRLCGIFNSCKNMVSALDRSLRIANYIPYYLFVRMVQWVRIANIFLLNCN